MRRAASLLLVLVAASPSLAQTQDPKQVFAAALGGVTQALEGRFGDDASRVHDGLASLEASLSAWDDAIRSFEASLALESANATPRVATRLHVAMALSLAERGRIDDALAQLQMAIDRSPGDVDAHTVLGLVHNQLTLNAAAAASAFREAAWYLQSRLAGFGLTSLSTNAASPAASPDRPFAQRQPDRARSRGGGAPVRDAARRAHLLPGWAPAHQSAHPRVPR